MFNKKICRKCGRKIERKFEYCPCCGSYTGNVEKEQRDYGFLGKNIENFNLNDEIKLPFGFNALFRKLMKEMDNQFREFDRELGKEKEEKMKKTLPVREGGISINITGGEGAPIIRVKSFGNIPEFKNFGKIQPEKKEIIKQVDEKKAKEFAKLPREEASSKVRRLSGKVVYEIDLPEVKSEKDVIVNSLENSIEVKAFAKDKAYFKFLPISLPLEKYKFEKGKLILEFKEA